MLHRWVLSRDRKTATEGAEVTRSGRLFQTRAAATGKARSPTVRSRVRLTINDEDELERSCWRASTSATWQSSSVRYTGADEEAEWCAGTSTRKRWAEQRRSSLTAAVTGDMMKRRQTRADTWSCAVYVLTRESVMPFNHLTTWTTTIPAMR